MRSLPLALLALFTANAVAGRSTSAIGEYMSLFLDEAVGQYEMLCTAREPDTAAQWKAEVQRWRGANAAPLGELQAVARSIERAARELAFDMSSKETVDERAERVTIFPGFAMLTTSQPAIELAGLNDRQASVRCKSWREAIGPGGPFETGLAQAVAGGRRILQVELEQQRR